MKTLQKLRKRQNGVSIVSLAIGKKVSVEEECAVRALFVKNYLYKLMYLIALVHKL